MSRFWKLCLLIGVFFFVAQSDDMQDPGETADMNDEGVSIPPHDYTADEGDEGGSAGDEPIDMEDPPPDGEDDGDVSEEELKQVWQDQPLTSEAVVKMHEKMDANGDGKISKEELDAFSKSTRTNILKKETELVFEQTDGNKDGKVSLEELLEANFGVIEDDEDNKADGEEKVAQDESEKRAKELETEKFKLADVNKDGLLDKDELAAVFYPEVDHKMLELVAQNSLKARDKDGDGLLTMKEFWGDVNTENEDAHDVPEQEHFEMHKGDFEKLDLDKDGKLNLKEILSWESGAYHMDDAMAQLLHAADENSDGHITAVELDKAREPLANSPAHGHLQSWAEHYGLISEEKEEEL